MTRLAKRIFLPTDQRGAFQATLQRSLGADPLPVVEDFLSDWPEVVLDPPLTDVEARLPITRFDFQFDETGSGDEVARAESNDPDGERIRFPTELTESQAVLRAHEYEIQAVSRYLRARLSVLIECPKLLVAHLVDEIVMRSGLEKCVLSLNEPRDEHAGTGVGAIAAAGRRQQLLAQLQQRLAEARPEDVVVVPHLDLLAGGSDPSLTPEARELTDVVYERSDSVILAFSDPSLSVPQVLADRFAVRAAIDTLPREIAGSAPIVVTEALVTDRERDLFDGFSADELYKHVAGMNAASLRHGMRYALQQHEGDAANGSTPTFDDLIQELRAFKADTSSAFEVPKTQWDEIGGYAEVKNELRSAVEILSGAARLPARMRHELVPKGFVFYGPPGTGKTLFAKAVATELKGTIQVVSGPEITDMYVGESERKLRSIFNEARRNSPSVLVLDEFDSIASKRSGRDDGGSRANNAMVAQMLTEMDGFRPEVPVLVIGTTNRIDMIDDALLRPSRFKAIEIGLPKSEARRRIAEVHAAHFEIEVTGRLLDEIAVATEGFNGDEIRSVFRDAKVGELMRHRPATPRELGRLVAELGNAKRDLKSGQQREISATAANYTTPRAGVLLTPTRDTDSTAISTDHGDGGIQ